MPGPVLGRVLLVLCCVLLGGGCTSGAAEPQADGSGTSRPKTSPSSGAVVDIGVSQSALDLLSTLQVKGRAPMTGYDRDQFGQSWLDADRNGCDTRNDVLARDLNPHVFEPGTHDCVVVTGDLADPYTNGHIRFVKGDGTLVDVDHVVALGNGWVTGAFAWEIRKRAAFANDPLNLLAVDASANRQKGDGDAATWLPRNKDYRCSYIARQVTVKAKYGLWVTAPEKEAMQRVLSTCPEQVVTPDSGAPVVAPVNVPTPSGPAEQGSEWIGSASEGSSNAEPYYANCDDARTAGVAPVRRGDAGYGAHLDGDGDGSACE